MGILNKKYRIVLGVIVIALICMLIKIYPTFQNKLNFELVETGMSKQEVLKVMGVPDFKYSNIEKDSVYYYHSPPLASEGFEVGFNSKNQAYIIK